METTDFEVLQTNLFEHHGLGDLAAEEKEACAAQIDQLLGVAGLFRAAEQLEEKDQDTLGRLMAEQEVERAQAFLAVKGIDLEQVTITEIARVKRALMETNRQFDDIHQFRCAFKKLLPEEVNGIDIATAQAAAMNQVVQMFEELELPPSDEMYEKVKGLIDGRSELRLHAEVSDELQARTDQLFDDDKSGEAISLLLENDIDLAQIYLEEANTLIEKMKRDYEAIKL